MANQMLSTELTLLKRFNSYMTQYVSKLPAYLLLLLLLSGLIFGEQVFAASTHPISSTGVAGYWKLNIVESDKVSETYEEGSGAGRSKIFNNVSVSGSVLGLPIPKLGSRIPSQSGMVPKTPSVLLCTTMQIAPDGSKLTVVYDANEKETLRKGSYRGRKSSWSSKKVKQKYKTPDRTVTKTWTIRPDGRLLVAVKLNPPKDKSRTFKRVFDRVAPPVEVTDAGTENLDADATSE